MTAALSDTSQHNCAESTLLRSYGLGGNTNGNSAVPPRSRPCPAPLLRSVVAATSSVGHGRARGGCRALWKHRNLQSVHTEHPSIMLLQGRCTPCAHQSPTCVTDELQADRKVHQKTLVHHLLQGPNAPISLGASSHSLLGLQEHFQGKLQTNQPWDHQQQLLPSACEVLNKSTEMSSHSHQNLDDVDDKPS